MAPFGFLVTIFIQSFSIAYSWLYDNLVSPFIAMARGFELAIAVFIAIIFLLTAVFVALKQAKKLPKSYAIEVENLYGERTVSLDGLRLAFATYDAAESYARFYRQTYGDQYKFRVFGLR